jgi:hypothetical protein
MPNTQYLFFRHLFYLVAVLDLVHKNLGWLETGYVVLVNNNGRIARDVAGDFFLSLFIDKAAEPSHIDIVTSGHIALYYIKECFYRGRNICFIDTCFVCNLVDDVGFSHGDGV